MDFRIIDSLFGCFLCIFMIACAKEEHDSSFNDESCRMFAAVITDETEYADVLMMCDDGSYIICDADHGDGYGVIYYNQSVDNDFSNGLAVFLDSEGVPQMISYDNTRMILHETQNGRYDVACFDNDNNAFYAYDIDISDEITKSIIATKSWYTPWTNSWKDFGSSIIHWSWDEHQRKALVPFACKVVAFGLMAVDVVVTPSPLNVLSLVVTAGQEASKSAGYSPAWFSYLDRAQEIKGLASLVNWKHLFSNGEIAYEWGKGIGFLGTVLNEWADVQLASIGEIQEIAEQVFGSEWQIKLSHYSIDAGPDGGNYTVAVDTRAAWSIDDSNVDKSWCTVEKNGNSVIVNVSPYSDGLEEKKCYATIHCTATGYDDKIPPARLTITQAGVKFELSATRLDFFTQYAGNGAVTASYNNRVTSWTVTSHPTWCRFKLIPEVPLPTGVAIIVDDDLSLLEPIEDIVTVTATLKDGHTLNRYLVVKRSPLVWDKTSWSFKPNLNVKTTGSAEYSGALDIIDVSIHDPAAGSFDSNFPWSSMSLDSEGKLSFKYNNTKTQTWKDGDGKTHSATVKESASMQLTRIDEGRAHAVVSCSGSWSGDVSGSISGAGQCDGNRTGYTKSFMTTIESNILRNAEK